jgi:hypothetical protein
VASFQVVVRLAGPTDASASGESTDRRGSEKRWRLPVSEGHVRERGVQLLADRQSPDYASSIKESVSTVEKS